MYFTLCLGLAGLMISHSRRQDEDGDPKHRFANVGLSTMQSWKNAPMIPLKDPLLEKSLHHH